MYLSDGTGEERHLFSFTEKGNDLKLEEGGKEKRKGTRKLVRNRF